MAEARGHTILFIVWQVQERERRGWSSQSLFRPWPLGLPPCMNPLVRSTDWTHTHSKGTFLLTGRPLTRPHMIFSQQNHPRDQYGSLGNTYPNWTLAIYQGARVVSYPYLFPNSTAQWRYSSIPLRWSCPFSLGVSCVWAHMELWACIRFVELY